MEFDLFVTVVCDSKEVKETLKANFPNVDIFVVSNKGKDIGGFLADLRKIL